MRRRLKRCCAWQWRRSKNSGKRSCRRPESWPSRSPTVARYIADGGAVIAWDGECAVGSARFHPEPACFYIGRVAVPPAYRRRGIATAIMQFLEDHARSLGFRQTRVEVRQALPSNIALYESLGYEQTGIRPHPRVPTAQVITMSKRLGVSSPVGQQSGPHPR